MLTDMWHHVIENTLPALVGAGVVGLIFGLTKQRPPAWILLMVLMIGLIAAGTQIIWELYPRLHQGWELFAVVIGIAAFISLLFSPLMQRFCKNKHDA